MGLFDFFSSSKLPAILVFYEDYLHVAHLEKEKTAVQLISFNETGLETGLIEGGEVKDTVRLKEVLKQLFAEAQPRPVVAKKAFVNVPYQMLYPFVKDFSHHGSKEGLEANLLKEMQHHSPIPADQLEVHFYEAERDHIFSFGGTGVPKAWEKKIQKVCQAVGIKEIEFIPEPFAQMTLFKEEAASNFALLSNHEDQIFLSLFRNDLLYDTYFIDTPASKEAIDCNKCADEFLKADEDFKSRFSGSLETLYLLDFSKELRPLIEEALKAKAISHRFISSKDSEHAKLIPSKRDCSTLIGMAIKALES